jgi:hypothetical protein
MNTDGGWDGEDLVVEALGSGVPETRGKRAVSQHREDVVGEQRQTVPGGARRELPARRDASRQSVLRDVVDELDGAGLTPSASG